MKREFLTKDKEYELIEKYQNTGCQESLNSLIDNNLGLIIKTANKKCGRLHHDDLNDLINEGVLAAISAISKFDTTRNLKLVTYLGVCICGKMNEYIRKQLGMKAQDEKGDWIIYNSLYTQPFEYLSALEDQDKFEEAFSNLTPIQQDLLIAKHTKRGEILPVIQKYNIAKQTATKLVYRAKAELKELLCVEL